VKILGVAIILGVFWLVGKAMIYLYHLLSGAVQ
jgi:hypothetical protein